MPKTYTMMVKKKTFLKRKKNMKKGKKRSEVRKEKEIVIDHLFVTIFISIQIFLNKM